MRAPSTTNLVLMLDAWALSMCAVEGCISVAVCQDQVQEVMWGRHGSSCWGSVWKPPLQPHTDDQR